MAWLKMDPSHEEIMNLLLSSPRVGSPAGRTKTGPFAERRQLVVFAAALGAAAGRRRQVASSGALTMRDSIVLEAPGATELAFSLAYRDAKWDLAVIADGEEAAEMRLRALEEYAAGGLDVLAERYAGLGSNVSAADLLLDVKRHVSPPDAALPVMADKEREEDPLIAVLRRRGKLPPQGVTPS